MFQRDHVSNFAGTIAVKDHIVLAEIAGQHPIDYTALDGGSMLFGPLRFFLEVDTLPVPYRDLFWIERNA